MNRGGQRAAKENEVPNDSLTEPLCLPHPLFLRTLLSPHLTQEESPITFRKCPPLFSSFQELEPRQARKEGTNSCA